MVFSKLVICLLLLSCSASIYSKPLRIVTEEFPPLQMANKNGVATGAMVDIIHLLLEKVNIEATIEFYPWARSYKIAKEPNNTLIFSMYRDEIREDKFQWIGQLLTVNSYLVSFNKNKNFNISSIEDAKKYKIGGIREDLGAHYLKKNGFTERQNLFLSRDPNFLWKLLYSDRTDLAFTSDVMIQHELKGMGLDSSKIQFVYKIPNFASHLYLAASLDVDKSVVERIQKALSMIKSNGEYQHILQKWNLPLN